MSTGAPPAMLLGEFTDDYDNRYTITDSSWLHRPRASYLIHHWNVAQGYLIARNAPTSPYDAGLWTRIDWVELEGMEPYDWAFCLSAYKAPTMAAAESTAVARRDTVLTGCNGYPFSRMRRVTH